MEIKTCLNILGLDEKNNGTSTGSISFSSSELIDSISPVDGKKLVLLVKHPYRIIIKLLKLQLVHLNFGEKSQLQKEEKLFDNLEIV